MLRGAYMLALGEGTANLLHDASTDATIQPTIQPTLHSLRRPAVHLTHPVAASPDGGGPNTTLHGDAPGVGGGLPPLATDAAAVRQQAQRPRGVARFDLRHHGAVASRHRRFCSPRQPTSPKPKFKMQLCLVRVCVSARSILAMCGWPHDLF
jgi:hypothetical protein